MNVRLTLFLTTLTTVSLIHRIAIEFYLYWRYLWIDIPIHFLGGACVSLGIASMPFFGVRFFERFRTLSFYILVVLAVGALWEIFELTAGITVVDETFLPDTILDLAMDILGGAFGYWLVDVLEKR